MSDRVPSYRRHKQSGQAVVTLSDGFGGRRDVLLGKFGTAESRKEYARIISEWEAAGRRLPPKGAEGSALDLTVNELCLAFQRPISDDPHDQLLLQIQGAVAEYERAVLGERFRRGRLQKARAGQWTAGKAPYGYRYVPKRDGVPGHLVLDDAEAAVVRLLYRWLIDEQMTVRQILKRLAAGPWRPRSGRRLWSNSVVHRILSDPVYTGTGYHNRYSFEVPKRPRTRGPRSGERTCRRPRPRDEWVAIPVPPIIDEATYEQASAQLARNSVLSFRNNTRHDYLLRCLLTCKTCGLSLFGVTVHAADGTPRWRYYRCHGRDCVSRDRDRPCPQRQAKVEELDAAVWGHIKGLLNDPVTLLGQFEAFAREAEEGPADERAQEEKWATQLRRLGREEQRLLDAYQAEVIDLPELKERRQRLAGRREALTAQRDQQARLRAERGAARETLADLWSFCERIRLRLDEATLAERQRLLHLLIERVIVGENTLEIRHVIPLRRLKPETVSSVVPEGPSEGSGPAGVQAEEGGERLRSDGVRPAPLQPSERPVHPGTVAVDHPRISLSQPLGENVGSARGSVGEHREGCRYEGPDPALGLAFLGRRLIDIQDGLLRQLADQLVIGRLHRLGGQFLQRHHPAGTGRLIEDHTQEEGGAPLGLAEAGQEQAAERDQAWSGLASRDTGGQGATSDRATATGQAMALVFGDAGLDFRQFPNLVPQGLEIGAAQGCSAATAGRRHAGDDALALLGGEERPLVLGVARLAAGSSWRFPCRTDRLVVGVFGRRWLGGIGGVLVEPGFEVGDVLLVVLDQG
jgi:site-specific DNA recombinase